MPRTTRAILSGLLAVLALTACGPVNPASPPQARNPLNRLFYVDLTAGWTAAIGSTVTEPGRVNGLGSRNAAILIERLDLYDMTDPKKDVNHPHNGAPHLPILNDRISTYGPNRYGINFDIGGERGWRFPIEVEPDPGHVYQIYVHASTLALYPGDDIGCRIWEFGGGEIDSQVTDYAGPRSLHRTISVTCHGQVIT